MSGRGRATGGTVVDVALNSESGSSEGSRKLIHHNIAKEDTSRALTSWLSPRDFKWMLTGTSWITEAQTFYMIGDDGSFIMIQMAYSNLR